MSSLALPKHWQFNWPLLMAHLKKGPGGNLLRNDAGHLVKGCSGSSLCCKDTIGINCTISGAVYAERGLAVNIGTPPFFNKWDLRGFDYWDYRDANATWYRALTMLDGATKTSGNCYTGFDGNSTSSDVIDVLIGEVTERHYSQISADPVSAPVEPVWVESDATGSYAYYLVDHVSDLYLRFGPGNEFRMVSKITSSTLTTVGPPAGSPPSGGAGVQTVGTELVVVGEIFPLLGAFRAKGFCASETDDRRHLQFINYDNSVTCDWSPEL